MTGLATIRRAYRYVAAYERRILDAIARVDDALIAAGFDRRTPHRWAPIYNAFPSRDWPAENWVWDRLPGYACRFEWVQGEPNQSRTRYVLVDHIADTGFEDARRAGKAEPELLAGFASPEAGKSVLRWACVDFHATLPYDLWKLSWRELLAKHFKADQRDIFTATSGREPVLRRSAELLLAVACTDLEEFSGPHDLDQHFIGPLLQHLNRGASDDVRDRQVQGR